MQLPDSSDDSPNVLVFQVTEHMQSLKSIFTKLVLTVTFVCVCVCVDRQSNCNLKTYFLIDFAVNLRFSFFVEVKCIFGLYKISEFDVGPQKKFFGFHP